MYPKVILKLIEDFQQLPGIGEKTAERLALHVVTKMPKD
ncbi:MAG: recombination protein RecR, partial [Acholeplasmataceae bacterium]